MRDPSHAPSGFIRSDDDRPPRRKANSWRTALIIAGVVTLVVIVVGALGVVQTANQPRTVTVVSTPTSTPRPSLMTGAMLGGLPDAFTAKYGQSTSDGSYQTRIGGHTVQITIASAPAADGSAHVSQVLLAFVGSGFSESETDQLTSPLLPSDAQSASTTGDSAHYLIEFTSVAIGEVFPDSAGDFHILCTQVNAKTQQTTCIYALGFNEDS